MTALKKLIGQTAIYGLSSIVGRLLNYLLVPLYVRVFPVGEIGLYGELYAYIAILMVLLTHGMETAYFRFSSNQEKEVLPIGLISHLIASSVFVAIFYTFQDYILQKTGYESDPILLQLLVFVLVADTLSTLLFAKLRKDGRPLYFGLVKLSNIGLNIGLNLFFLVLCPHAIEEQWAIASLCESVYHPEIGIAYILISNLAASVLSFLMLSPLLIKQKWEFHWDMFKPMLKYSLPLMVAGLAYVINETLDRIWLKFAIGEYEAGIYNACYKLSILMTIFIQAIRLGVEPFFFSHAKNQDASKAYALIMKYTILLGLIIYLGVVFYLDFIKHFLDEKYFSGLGVVPILLMANLMLGIYFNLSVWYKLKDKTHYGAIISSVGAVVTISLNYLLIPLIGYMGSAITTLTAYTFMVVLSYVLGRKHYQFGYDIPTIIMAFTLCLTLHRVSYTFETSMLTNTVLLLTFVGLLAFKERHTLKTLLSK